MYVIRFVCNLGSVVAKYNTKEEVSKAWAWFRNFYKAYAPTFYILKGD